MTPEYDLVVIGSSQEGIYAALTAVQHKTRIALVDIDDRQIGSEAILNHAIGCLRNRISPLKQGEREVFLQGAMAEIVATVGKEESFVKLASLGVDIISSKAEFINCPPLALQVNKRKLFARAYLIATGSYTSMEEIEGIGYCLGATDLWVKFPSLPQEITIVGGEPTSLALAQNLALWGKNVTLIVEETRLLAAQDTEAVNLLQAQLEADGVKILLGSPLKQIKIIDGKKWLQVGNKAIETEEIILTGKRSPNVRGLNLSAVGVQYSEKGIKVNQKLQTTNQKIYVCGDALGGYSLDNLGIYEVNIVLSNVLFSLRKEIDYRFLPWSIFTEPNLSRVGITEVQARAIYGNNIRVLKQDFTNLISARIEERTTGFCKIILCGNGEILGAHILGECSSEYIGIIALAMQNKIKINRQNLTTYFPFVSSTYGEIIRQTIEQFAPQ